MSSIYGFFPHSHIKTYLVLCRYLSLSYSFLTYSNFNFNLLPQAEPTATLVTINSTHSCSSKFLLSGTDTTTIVYEISGNSSHYQFSPSSGPAFHFTKNGVDSEVSEDRLHLSSHNIVADKSIMPNEYAKDSCWPVWNTRD